MSSINNASVNKVTHINQKEHIQEQACQWISRIDRGLTKAERESVQIWLAQNEAHKTALFEMAALWDDLSVMHELGALFPLAEKSDNSSKTENPAKTENRRWHLATAASIAFACALTLTWMGLSLTGTASHPPKNMVSVPQISVFETGVGEQKTVNLQDGSLLSLNTGSTVKVDFTDSSRSIDIIKGEAHFEVASDAARPFIVSAGQNKVTAIGTAFNVQLLENQRFELLVTEGKVLVSEISQPTPENIGKLKSQDFSALGTIMVSGDTGVFSGFDAELRDSLSLDQVQRNLSWQQGMLVFQGEPLVEALAEMSRYTDSEFEIIDEDLKRLRVAGYFKVGDTEGLLYALRHNFQIQHTESDNVIQLSAQGSR